MPDPDLDVLTFRHSVAQRPWWVFHGTILLSLVIAGGIFVALDWIVPQLEEIFRPFPLIGVEIAFLVIAGLLFEVLLGHTVLLSPRGVRIQWGPFGKTAATTSVVATLTYDDGRREYLGVLQKTGSNIYFGAGYLRSDFEKARTWLQSFAEQNQIPYERVRNREELFRFVRAHSKR